MQRLYAFILLCRAGFAIISFVLLTLAVPSVGYSADSDMYKVEDIAVDTRDKNATAARTKAIAKAQHEAFYTLLKRLVPPSAYATLPQLTPEQVAPMVRGFEVKDEKITTERYRAKLTITFNPEYVRTTLREHQISFTDKKSAPVLLLPVLEKGGKTLLWDNDNPWRTAWNEVATKGEFVQLLLPSGDLEDIATVTPSLVLSGDYAQLRPLLDKYGVKEVVVVVASYSQSDPAHSEVNVTLRRLEEKGAKVGSMAFSGGAESDMPLLLAGVARNIMSALENEWKATTQPKSAQPESAITVVIPLSDIQEWGAIRKRLTALPFLQGVSLKELSVNEAIVDMGYQGDLQALLEQLNQQGIYLVQDDGKVILKTSM